MSTHADIFMLHCPINNQKTESTMDRDTVSATGAHKMANVKRELIAQVHQLEYVSDFLGTQII
jgi:hypothetical protein